MTQPMDNAPRRRHPRPLRAKRAVPFSCVLPTNGTTLASANTVTIFFGWSSNAH